MGERLRFERYDRRGSQNNNEAPVWRRLFLRWQAAGGVQLVLPIYEFHCKVCRRRTSVFTRSVSSEVLGACEHCGSKDLSRLFSRVAVHRSANGDARGFDESSLGDVDENDPRSVAKWVRKMSRETGEPLDANMHADLDRMEAGEMPDDFADEPMEDFAGVD